MHNKDMHIPSYGEVFFFVYDYKMTFHFSEAELQENFVLYSVQYANMILH